MLFLKQILNIVQNLQPSAYLEKYNTKLISMV